MKERRSLAVTIAFRTGMLSCLAFAFESIVLSVIDEMYNCWYFPFNAFVVASIVTNPVLPTLFFIIQILKKFRWHEQPNTRIILGFLICSCHFYGAPAAVSAFNIFMAFGSLTLPQLLFVNTALVCCVIPPWYITRQSHIKYFVTHHQSANIFSHKLWKHQWTEQKPQHN